MNEILLNIFIEDFAEKKGQYISIDQSIFPPTINSVLSFKRMYVCLCVCMCVCVCVCLERLDRVSGAW